MPSSSPNAAWRGSASASPCLGPHHPISPLPPRRAIAPSMSTWGGRISRTPPPGPSYPTLTSSCAWWTSLGCGPCWPTCWGGTLPAAMSPSIPSPSSCSSAGNWTTTGVERRPCVTWPHLAMPTTPSASASARGSSPPKGGSATS